MKKGFTLVELLAVIVVLAIIALIAVPIVQKIIKQSEEASRKRSVELYGKAVEQAIADYSMNNTRSTENCTIDGRVLSCKINEETIETKIDYKGSEVVCTDSVVNKDGTYYISGCKIDGKEVAYEYGTKKMFKNGDVVYFDVLKGKGCSKKEYDETNSYTEYNGTNKEKTYDAQNSCLKFYAFLDDGSDKLNLILDHNTTDNIKWTLSASLKNGPGKGEGEILYQLKENTKEWKGTIQPDNYKVTQLNCGNYTIDYTGYKARLITAQEVADITNITKNSNFDENTSEYSKYYFDTGTTLESDTCKEENTSGCKFGWLYDRTSTNCEIRGCLNNSNKGGNRYYTATSETNNLYAVWLVGINYFDSHTIFMNYSYGVRPVIEVSKSSLK